MQSGGCLEGQSEKLSRRLRKQSSTAKEVRHAVRVLDAMPQPKAMVWMRGVIGPNLICP